MSKTPQNQTGQGQQGQQGKSGRGAPVPAVVITNRSEVQKLIERATVTQPLRFQKKH